jgi:hypothetical protein
MASKNSRLQKLIDCSRPRRAARRPAARKPTNHVILVLDSSGSMSAYRRGAEQAFSDQVVSVRAEAAKNKQPVELTTITFSTHVNQPNPNFDASSYSPAGQTNLFGAISEAINYANEVRIRNDTVLISVITDGEETEFRLRESQIRDIIGNAMSDENFSIIAHCPPGHFRDRLINIGIPAANITIWEASERGILELSRSTTRGVGGYFTAMSMGASPRAATAKYIADMSAVTPSVVNRMDDVSSSFKRWRVANREGGTEIADFVRGKGGVYAAGRAFYQLTKPEKVSAKKTLVILDRQTGAIYTGNQARTRLGLPLNQDIKLVPGANSDFVLFVQSTSYNRKLVGDTTVLYNVQ